MFKGSVFDELGAAKEASEQHATVSEATGKAEFKVAAGAFASNRSQVLWFVIFDDNGNGTELVRKYFVLYEGKNESVTITLPAK